jgi:hypothetical protein
MCFSSSEKKSAQQWNRKLTNNELNKLFTLILFNAAKYDKFPFNNITVICKTFLFFDIIPNKSNNGVVYPKSND